MEVVLGDAVVLSQMPLGLVPEVFDAVDVVSMAIGELSLMVDPAMAKARDIELIVGEVAIGIDHGIQHYLGVYDGNHGRPRRIRQHLGVDPLAALEDAEHRHLARRSAASLASAAAAKIALVDLDLAPDRALVFDASGHDLAQPVVEQGCGVLVDPDQIGRGTRRCAGDEVLAQPKCLFLAEF